MPPVFWRAGFVTLWHPGVMAVALAVACAYLWAIGPMRRRLEGSAPVPRRQVACFLAGAYAGPPSGMARPWPAANVHIPASRGAAHVWLPAGRARARRPLPQRSHPRRGPAEVGRRPRFPHRARDPFHVRRPVPAVAG